jgi:hypothetical protein
VHVAQDRRRFGYRRLHVLLKRDGYVVKHKKLFRFYGQLPPMSNLGMVFSLTFSPPADLDRRPFELMK